MNIAELFVRVRGDTGDVTRQLKTVEGSLAGVERASVRLEGGMGRAHVSTGKLRQELQTLVRQVTGTSPVVTQLSGLLGEFALGSTAVVGVTGGVAAIAYAFDKLTESSRKAMAAGDKLIETYNQAAKVFSLGIGGQQKADLETINKGVEEHVKWLTKIVALRSTLNSMGGIFSAAAGLLGGTQAGHSAQITAGGTAVTEANRQIAAAQDEEKKKAADKAAQAAAKLAAAALQADETFWRGQGQLWKQATEKVAQLNELARQYLLDNPISKLANDLIMGNLPSEVSMPNIQAPFEGLTDAQKDTLRQLGVLTDKADKNTETIANAVLGGAGIIVNALNIGGGGRGSGIGGALGSVVGTAGGSMLASHIGSTFGSLIAPGVGTIIGGLAGSLLGGLFDHKKAIDRNTDQLRLMNSLLNEPTGFKAEYYRDQVSVARRVYRNLTDTARQEASRGGSGGFQLAGT